MLIRNWGGNRGSGFDLQTGCKKSARLTLLRVAVRMWASGVKQAAGGSASETPSCG